MKLVNATVENLKVYMRDELQKTAILEPLDRFIQEGSSKAGTRREEVFTREFLCPVIGSFFYVHARSELNMSDEQIKAALGTEGFENCPGFGFTPGHRSNHLFTKSDIITLVQIGMRAGEPPGIWWGRDRPRFDTAQHRRVIREWILQYVEPAAQAGFRAPSSRPW